MSVGKGDDLRTRLLARSYGELLDVALFWLEIAGAPPPAEAIVEALAVAMIEPDRISSRLRALADKPKAVLAATLRAPGGSFASTTHAATGLKGYEFDSAAAELVKRGFLFSERRGGAVIYRAASDAAAPLAEALSQDGRSLDSIFSRAGFLRGAPPDGAQSGPLAPRVDAAAARAGDLVRDLIQRLGGLVTRATFEKLDAAESGSEWNRPLLRDALESAGLGTAARLSLEEYGIGLRDEALIAFHETLRESIAGAEPIDPGDLEVASAGVDGLADLSAIVSRVHAKGARLTLGSRLYKTSRRVLGGEMVSKEIAGAEEILDFLLQFARHAQLVATDEGQRLGPSPGAAAFESLPLREKLRRVVAFSLGERSAPEIDFHMRRLRKTLVACAAETRPGVFVSVGAIPALARNRYFAEMDRLSVREQYQSLYQHLKAPPTADPLALTFGALRFITRRLHPLGIFDLGLRGGRVEAVRLTELGAEVLSGVEPRRTGEGEAGALIVNPDFEIVVFPESATPEILYALSRFAKRTKADRVSTYRMTRESVAQAAAAGMSADEIVLALDRNARVEVPQNVVVTLRDWARGGRIHLAGGTILLEASDAESLESLLRIPGLAGLVARRVSESAVELVSRPADPALAEELERRGIRVNED